MKIRLLLFINLVLINFNGYSQNQVTSTASIEQIPEKTEEQLAEEKLNEFRQQVLVNSKELRNNNRLNVEEVDFLIKSIKKNLNEKFKEAKDLDDIILQVHTIMATTSQAALENKADMLDTVEKVAIAINEEIINWPNTKNTDWIEVLAKVTDALIIGSLKPALQAKTPVPELANKIAYGTALPYMRSKALSQERLIKVAKGINYGIPYKFIDSILKSAPEQKVARLIQKISRKTAYGTISAAIDSGIDYEKFVHAATDAFSSSIITLAAKRKMPVKKIAELTKFGARGIMAGTIDSSSDHDLPLGEMGAITITDLQGHVRFKRVSTNEIFDLDKLKVGDNIFQDYSITTNKNSSVTLLFSNGTITTNSTAAIKYVYYVVL